MKAELKPIAERLEARGFDLRAGTLSRPLCEGYVLFVELQTSKFGLPRGSYYGDAALSVRWEALEAKLLPLTTREVPPNRAGVGALLGSIVGAARWSSWVIQDPVREDDLVNALLAEGIEWASGYCDAERQCAELERNARSGFGFPIRWPLARLLLEGEDAALEAARELLAILDQRSAIGTTVTDRAQTVAFIGSLAG